MVVAILLIPPVGFALHWVTSGAVKMMEEVYIWAIYGLAATGTVFTCAFVFNLACAPYRIERDAHKATKRELERLRLQPQKPSLILSFDPKAHKLTGEDGKRAWLRVEVKNGGRQSVREVSVKIAEISGETKAATQELQKYIGLPLCTTIDTSAGYRVPMEKPQHLVTLHQSEMALFDVVQLCALPGNHHLLHAMYQRAFDASQMENNGGSPIEQQPSGTIPPGKYTIVLSAVGEDVEPNRKKFEFSADEYSVDFHEV